MKNIGVVVLCRYNSSRLPGKILMEISGKKTIDYILERLKAVVSQEMIVVATSNESSDDPIEQHLVKSGIEVFRGSLDNVAERFFQSSIGKNWEYIIRINGDNIFLDTSLLYEMINIANSNDFDFISNVKNRTFPKGMSIEIVNSNHYQLLLPKISNSKFHSEHVTSYLYENDENQNYSYIYNTIIPEAAGIQLALDDVDDLVRTEKVISQFKEPQIKYNLKEIYNLYKTINHEQ